MTKILEKQIKHFENASFMINNVSVDGSGSDNVTSDLSISDKFGNAYTVQKTNSDQSIEGFIVESGLNIVDIFDNSADKRIVDDENREVYAKLTEASGVFTLTYYVNDEGTETAYSIPSGISINFIVKYNSDWSRTPKSAKQGFVSRIIANDPSQLGGRYVSIDSQTISATNTVADLPDAPIAGTISFKINGVEANNGFSVSGKAITVDANSLGYSLETSDRLSISYETKEVA